MQDIKHDLKPNEYQFGATLNEELKKVHDNIQEIVSLDNPLPSYAILIKDPGNSSMLPEIYDWKIYVDDNHNLITAKNTADGWEIMDTNTF